MAIRALDETDIPNVEWQVQATAARILFNAGHLQESELARTRAIEVSRRVTATLSDHPAHQMSLLGQIAKELATPDSGSPAKLVCATSASFCGYASD